MNVLIEYGAEINAILALAFVVALSVPRKTTIRVVFLCLAGTALCLALTIQAIHVF